jgi:hypothetical protein
MPPSAQCLAPLSPGQSAWWPAAFHGWTVHRQQLGPAPPQPRAPGRLSSVIPARPDESKKADIPIGTPAFCCVLAGYGRTSMKPMRPGMLPAK